MNNIWMNLRPATLVSAILVLPFVLLEWVNRRNFDDGFPVALIGFMWLLSLTFMLLLMPIVRNLQAGNSPGLNPLSLLLRVVALILIACLWGSLILDQLPCFLGVPNCD